MVGCPKSNKIFGKKCSVSVNKTGKTCEDAYDLISCFGDQDVVPD